MALMSLLIDSGNSPELLFGTRDNYHRLVEELRSGNLRKIATGIYTPNLIDSPEAIIRRNYHELLRQFYPNCVLSYKSALQRPEQTGGNLYLTVPTAKTRNSRKFPSLAVHIFPGAGQLPGDYKLADQVFNASLERAYIECMEPSRTLDGHRKGWTDEEAELAMEAFLARNVHAGSKDHILAIRNLGDSLGKSAAAERLVSLIETLLGKHQGKWRLLTQAGRARATGSPLDSTRVDIFRDLAIELTVAPHQEQPSDPYDPQGRDFFESYFSNYIEGTRFLVSEAWDICIHRRITNRPKDAHDVLGTYQQIVDKEWRGKTPKSAEEFLDILRKRHQLLMEKRPEVRPGQFKLANNQAGETVFVSPAMVEGTLKSGFEIIQQATTPFARALLTFFVIAEVHPFDDGNGRVARLCMNAELSAANQSRIVVPTNDRYSYVQCLKALSRGNNTKTFSRVMATLWQVSNSIPVGFDPSKTAWEQRRAFTEDEREMVLPARLLLLDHASDKQAGFKR